MDSSSIKLNKKYPDHYSKYSLNLCSVWNHIKIKYNYFQNLDMSVWLSMKYCLSYIIGCIHQKIDKLRKFSIRLFNSMVTYLLNNYFINAFSLSYVMIIIDNIDENKYITRFRFEAMKMFFFSINACFVNFIKIYQILSKLIVLLKIRK